LFEPLTLTDRVQMSAVLSAQVVCAEVLLVPPLVAVLLLEPYRPPLDGLVVPQAARPATMMSARNESTAVGVFLKSLFTMRVSFVMSDDVSRQLPAFTRDYA
jgi:hypothetical protein